MLTLSVAPLSPKDPRFVFHQLSHYFINVVIIIGHSIHLSLHFPKQINRSIQPTAATVKAKPASPS